MSGSILRSASSTSRYFPHTGITRQGIRYGDRPYPSRRSSFSSEPIVRPTESADVAAASEAIASSTAAESVPSPPQSSLGNVVRHGPGDGVVVLDVGGKEFRTLRSTVALNRVLAANVARAEASGEFSGKGGAVFVDRDPTYFPLILQHLRNEADDRASSLLPLNQFALSPKNRVREALGTTKNYVKLPTEKSKLREVYVEAVHFDIPELQNLACQQSVLTWALSKMGSKFNPFDAISNTMRTMRRGTLALAGLTAGVGAGAGSSILEYLPEWMRAALLPLLLSDKEEEKTVAVETQTTGEGG